ncbi:hypothetical protein [Nonomuraea sp. NEAU-A123]|uniref:hypothetical protein n=1 Tax=Nonomuraea sp. NEAU-A123 TaxID=2839649 RepID=UPI001BE4D9A7|nr:hypothetical protein [Nonomuraea sp. NEAU-A123]MBT2230423.1 hypothetical protein [Nonomuraea sp. NEAU-A123]
MTPAPVHEVHDRRLKELLGQVIAAEVPAIVVDQATAERWLLRLAGALLGINARHRVDPRGRCRLCRPGFLRRWWPQGARRACTVQPTLAHYLRDAEPFLFPTEDRGAS